MKRNLLFSALVIALGISSCKKDPPATPSTPVTPGITLTKSDALNAQSVTTPTSNLLLLQYNVTVTNTPGAKLVIGRIGLTGTDGLQISDVKNIRVVIKGDTVARLSSGAYLPDFEFSVPMGTTSTESVKVFVDVPLSFTHGTLTGTLMLGYISDEYQYAQVIGNPVSGQVTTFVSTSLDAVLDNTAPTTKLVLDGVEDTALVVNFTAQGVDQTLTSIKLGVTTPGILQTMNVYVDGVRVGTATPGNEFFVTVPVSFVIQNGTSKRMVITQISKPITTAQQSRSNIKLGLAEYTFTSPQGQVSTRTVAVMGNDLYLVSSYPQVDIAPIANNHIVDSVPMRILHIVIRAIGGPVSWKQIAIDMTLADQLTNNNLSLKEYTFLEGGTDKTDQVKFYNASGHEDSVYNEADTKLYIAWVGGNNEAIIPEGAMREYWLIVTPIGFVDNNSSGDELLVRTPTDRSETIGFRELTAGSSNTAHAKLRDANGAVEAFNFIWSDRSAGSAHSANLIIGSDDWFTGEYIMGLGRTDIFNKFR